MRPKAFGILQGKILQYLAWRDVRREQVKVRKLESLPSGDESNENLSLLGNEIG